MTAVTAGKRKDADAVVPNTVGGRRAVAVLTDTGANLTGVARLTICLTCGSTFHSTGAHPLSGDTDDRP